MEMKKNLYYNNDQFYAAVFVAVDQILRLHSCEATLPFAHEGPAHSLSRPEQAEGAGGSAQEAGSSDASVTSLFPLS